MEDEPQQFCVGAIIISVLFAVESYKGKWAQSFLFIKSNWMNGCTKNNEQ